MGVILAKKDTLSQCWARLRLESGELLWVSLAQGSIKISRMILGGFLPGRKIWFSDDMDVITETFFRNHMDRRDMRPLDLVISKVIDCPSIADVRPCLENGPTEGDEGEPDEDFPITVDMPDIFEASPVRAYEFEHHLAYIFRDISPLAARHGERTVIFYPYVLALTERDRGKLALFVTAEHGLVYDTSFLCKFGPTGNHYVLEKWNKDDDEDFFVEKALSIVNEFLNDGI